MRMYELSEPNFMGGGILFKEDEYMQNPKTKEAFLCGMKLGKEIGKEESYHERNSSGGGYSGGGSGRGGGYNQRDMDWEEMRRLEDEYHERRRRRSNGRFY